MISIGLSQHNKGTDSYRISRRERNPLFPPLTVISNGFEEIDNDRSPCYDCPYQCEKDGMKNMSFVGLSIGEDGIAGFGDRKSTVITELDTYKEDKGRVARKVFIFPKFILVTFGENIIKDPGIWHVKGLGMNVFLEDVLSKYVSDEPYETFLARFIRTLGITGEDRVYNFIIGYRVKDTRYEAVSVQVSRNGVIVQSRASGNCVITGGNRFYTARAQSLDTRLNGLNVRERAEAIPGIINDFIEEADKLASVYNPVGNGVDTEIFI